MSRKLILIITLFSVAACTTQPKVPYSTDFDVLAEFPGSGGDIEDGRGRFREIFCAVLEEHGHELPDYMPCDEALTLVGNEPAATGQPVNLGESQENFLIGIVPGFGWDCIEAWLEHENYGPSHVAKFGYKTAFIGVEGLSSTSTNARLINESLEKIPAENANLPLILIGYSKGAPDLLDFLVTYPEMAKRVVAVVSLAGAIGGSPLAIGATQEQAELMLKAPKADCDAGDGGGVNALLPEVRAAWMAEHPLPEHVKYYSVVTYPDPKTRMSVILKSSYKKIAELADARNDSQVVFYDQVIPGSTLLAFPNADHWSLAVPIGRKHKFISTMMVNHNDYPREAFLESILRYIEEDLAD